jgi:regulator of replication initiation timing
MFVLSFMLTRTESNQDIALLSLDGSVDESAQMAELLERLDQAKTELRTITAERGRERDLVARIRHTAIATKALFPGETDYKFTLDAPQAGRIAEHVLARDTLIVKFLKCKKEVNELDTELHRIRATNRNLQIENKGLMEHLRSVRDQANAQQADSSAESVTLTKMKSQNQILCNVFQSLIVASGVDWSTDPKLRDLMFSALASQPPA